MRYKKTEVCQTCAKLKNVCQTCLLDLEYGEIYAFPSPNQAHPDTICSFTSVNDFLVQVRRFQFSLLIFYLFWTLVYPKGPM